MKIVISDRYTALGITCPSDDVICQGHCEGTGIVPIYMNKGDKKSIEREKLGKPCCYPKDEDDPIFISLWEKAEEKEPSEDGWHFVICPECNGTGKREKK